MKSNNSHLNLRQSLLASAILAAAMPARARRTAAG
jgi:hypothetical protein